MKKYTLSLALLVGLGSAAQAQHASTFGITAAYARTSLVGGKSSGYTSTGHSAYQAGVTADAYLSDIVSFHPELLYTLRYFDATNADLSRDISYIDIPLLARLHADGLYFEAGPQISIPVTAKNEAKANVRSEVNSVAFDYVAGLGYQFGSGPSLGVRYDGGATNVFKNNSATTLGSGKFKTSTILFVVGYSFGG